MMLGMLADTGVTPVTTPVSGTNAIVSVQPASSAAVLQSLINSARASAGLKPLQWDEKLARAAAKHAEIMSERGELSHQFDGEGSLVQRLSSEGVHIDAASENVVYDVTPAGAHENFLGSAPHRANMLNPDFDTVGIGVVENGGILYIVEDFSRSSSNLSDSEAAQAVAADFGKLREEAGVTNTQFVQEPKLHEIACSMGERETPDSHPALGLPGARFAASYAATDPLQLPPSVAHLGAARGVNDYSVGACYVRTPHYPLGLYWVTIVLFSHPQQVATALPTN
jgi:hypothetical protein